MQQSLNAKTKRRSFTQHKNPLETVSDLGSSVVSDAGSGLKDMGSTMFDQLFGDYKPVSHERQAEHQKGNEEKKHERKSGTVFDGLNHQENVSVKQQIHELTQMIRSEVKSIRSQDATLAGQVKEIERVALQAHKDSRVKEGVYHIKFLELILENLRQLRAKIGESSSWLDALQSKKAKRGSAFATQSKKAGTAYSMSQEHQVTRNVQ